MRGIDFLKTLPEDPGPERERLILQAVLAGDIGTLTWTPIKSEYRGYQLTIFVSSDALLIGDKSDGVRFNVSHITAQKIADHFGSVLPTAKISDLIYDQALRKLPVCTQNEYDRRMMLTSRMLQHHLAVERARDGFDGLIAPVGKDWACTNRLIGRPGRSANYGLHDPAGRYQAVTKIGGKLWQPGPGLKHEATYTDYSQVVRLVCRTVLLLSPGAEEAVEMDIEDVARSPELCWLVSSEGVMPNLRHPAVPRPGEDVAVADTLDRRPMPLFTRTLRRGLVGDDVRVWQRLIRVVADGVFGPATEFTTKRWQADHGLVADGIVGPRTRRAAAKDIGTIDASDVEDVMLAEPPVDIDHISFVPCANYRIANRTEVDDLVIHCAEAAEKPSTAEAVASWGGGPDAPRASWNYVVDCDSVVYCVREKDVAWHVAGFNDRTIGIEHAGYTRQTRAEWLDPYSEGMLHISARLAALICGRWNLPVEFIDSQGLRDGKRGVTTHWEVTKAFRKSTHVDPGAGFPMDLYLQWVTEEMNA